jgi:hypothetical protein
MDFFFPGTGTGQVAAGDFKGTGRTDLAIWLTTPARLYLMTNASSQLATVPVDLNGVANASMTAADVDGNGSNDLVFLNQTTATLMRNTHGNPPLLALAAVAPASVIGGGIAQGSVTRRTGARGRPHGNPLQQQSGARVSRGPHDHGSTGASTAAFQVSTAAVAGASSVNINASCNPVTQTASLALVAPYSLSGVAINPASQFGGFSAKGTVVLSGAADSMAALSLASSNGALVSVPAIVTVPPGATAASFPMTLQPMAADTPVQISASIGGVTKTAGVTVIRPLDSVQVTKAEYTARSLQLKVEATSTGAGASLIAWNAATGTPIGNLAPAGGGKYTGSFTAAPPVLSISVKSSFGGITTGPVAQKWIKGVGHAPQTAHVSPACWTNWNPAIPDTH